MNMHYSFGLFNTICFSIRDIVSSNTFFFNSHSHTVITCQPCASSSFLFLISFDIFRLNLSSQNSVLDFGVVAYLQPSCLCQKQPFIHYSDYFNNTNLPRRYHTYLSVIRSSEQCDFLFQFLQL